MLPVISFALFVGVYFLTTGIVLGFFLYHKNAGACRLNRASCFL